MRFAVLFLALVACGPSFPEVTAPLEYASPLFGSGGWGYAAGQAQPGAEVPNGLVNVGPDTSGPNGTVRFLHFDGYWAGDNLVQGFSHLHLSGTGGADYGILSLMPTDLLDAAHLTADTYQSKFRKSTEVASPGFYGVTLLEGNIGVELTASSRVAHHRYTFPAGTRRVVLIDLDHHLDGGSNTDASLVIGADGHLRGHFHSVGDMSRGFGGQDIFFELRARTPWTSSQVWSATSPLAPGTTASGTGVGAALEFDATASAPVELQVAVSYVSAEGAAAALAAEAPGWDFDGMRAAAEKQWGDLLGRVRVWGGTDAERALFYSAVHHLFVMPNTSQDVDGTYRGHDGQLHQADGFTFVSNLSLWDTYRTAHPLYHLLAPDRGLDAVRSLHAMAQQRGVFPKWPMALGDSGSMVGAGAEVVLADAWARGVRGFDAEGAYGLLRAAALDATAPPAGRGGRGGVEDYDALGYVPGTQRTGSVSVTCEFAQDDFALGNLAEALGHADDAQRLRARSKLYTRLYDPASGFLRAKNPDGSLTVTSGFDPLLLSDEYVEANAWHTVFCAPHDVEGTVAMLGGQDAFIAKLTDFFQKSKDEFEGLAPDSVLRSFPRPYYWAGNEPDIHAAYLFAQAGRPDLTQRWVRWVEDAFFNPGVDGLPGNDDGGAMSAWWVFSALGFYPLVGTDQLIVGAPRFPKVALAVQGGTFTIEAPQVSAQNLYVQSVELNGKPLTTPMLRMADLKPGGTLAFTMGPKPSSWGRH